jgi:hypothetical protein
MEQKDGENRPLLRPAERELPSVEMSLEGAEDEELHRALRVRHICS